MFCVQSRIIWWVVKAKTVIHGNEDSFVYFPETRDNNDSKGNHIQNSFQVLRCINTTKTKPCHIKAKLCHAGNWRSAGKKIPEITHHPRNADSTAKNILTATVVEATRRLPCRTNVDSQEWKRHLIHLSQFYQTLAPPPFLDWLPLYGLLLMKSQWPI